VVLEMLRYGLLGGARPPLPWEFFASLGGGMVGAGVLFVLLYPWWTTFLALGIGELAVFEVAGGTLLGLGAARRARKGSPDSGRP
jgi:hypothetical protein